MNEEVSEKKMVSRNVAIALGIVCIIFVTGLVGAFAYYTLAISDRDDTIASRNNRIASLNSQIADQDNTISSLNSQISQLESNVTNLRNQVRDLNDIVNLAKGTIWVNGQTISQPASNYTSWKFSASYAGFLQVYVQAATSPSTYVRVIYTSYGNVNYDNQITVGTFGFIASFPILPSSNIEIRVGNSNMLNQATGTVTITYYY